MKMNVRNDDGIGFHSQQVQFQQEGNCISNNPLLFVSKYQAQTLCMMKENDIRASLIMSQKMKDE